MLALPYEKHDWNFALRGDIAPNQVIARTEFEVHLSNLYRVNVTKAVIGTYM